MLAMPLTGFFMSTLGDHAISFYGIFIVLPLADNQLVSKFFAKAHEILAYLLIVSLTLHVIGAFYHPVLQRIWILPKKENWRIINERMLFTEIVSCVKKFIFRLITVCHSAAYCLVITPRQR